MKKKYNYIVINFFRVTNPYSGASEVSYNFFKSIPSKDKKLIQFSNNNYYGKNIKNIKAKTIIEKIFKIKYMSEYIVNICKKRKNTVLIFEGASWVGYTFLLYKYLKNKLNNAKFIYHSHNIEYLLRKKNNNFIIAFLSKYFENFIGKHFDIFTSVSKFDQKQLNKIYNFKTSILSNGIMIPKIRRIKEKKLKHNYVFFCGSIEYRPNREALEILINDIMPKVNYIDPKIKLVVSGNKFLNYNSKALLNVGFLNKKKFYSYLKGASIFVNPMQTAFGSQIKMITALAFGKKIIASKNAILGLDIYKKKNNILITNNSKKFAMLILKYIVSKKYDHNISQFYQKKYSIKKITENFINKI